jgi:hypothetical protein
MPLPLGEAARSAGVGGVVAEARPSPWPSPFWERAFPLHFQPMAGIAEGAEWIEVSKLRQILDTLPNDAMVQASPLGNLVIYDKAGPVEGQQIAYIDLLTETVFNDPEPAADGAPSPA